MVEIKSRIPDALLLMKQIEQTHGGINTTSIHLGYHFGLLEDEEELSVLGSDVDLMNPSADLRPPFAYLTMWVPDDRAFGAVDCSTI